MVIGAFGVGMWLAASGVWALPLAVVVGLALALAIVARSVRRLGGITGDVLGASVEVAATAALVALALGASVSP
jgi:adenosylcobinamide-GDP ribazoletransferase